MSKILIDRQVVEQVLEAYSGGPNWRGFADAMDALKAALAEPVREPVATMTVREDMGADFKFSRPHTLQPGQQFYLCATPPQRPAEPVQEPVGQLQEGTFGRGQVMWFKKPPDHSMLYAAIKQAEGENT